jgi:CRISPR type IV-associated protein Csf1
MEIRYETRDSKGTEIVKMVQLKEYPVEAIEYTCPICHISRQKGIQIKKIVSSNFTDWAYVGEHVCTECSKLFSLYFYSYIVNPDGIRLLNVRQLRDELCKRQTPPFRFIITTSQKKHLFYRSVINNNSDRFAVNLETETIYTTVERMKFLFDFVELLQTLGASKKAMQNGEISFQILQKVGFKPLDILQNEMTNSREIQIPLFCGQKREITEEEAICNLTLLLKTS